MGMISKNFRVEEFVPKDIYQQFGGNSQWFVNPIIIQLAEFYKKFFLAYYQKKDSKVKDVYIIINDWHRGGLKQFRGYRPRSYSEGGENSQHRLGCAFDCDIIVAMQDGSRVEADYKEVHRVISNYEREFMDNGLTAVEDVSIATTWLHSDCRWLVDSSHVLVVKPI